MLLAGMRCFECTWHSRGQLCRAARPTAAAAAAVKAAAAAAAYASIEALPSY
jgi:hypothetical protein